MKYKMKTKICPKCKENKSITEFYKDKYSADKLTTWCKKCNDKHTVKYRKNNREKNIQYQKEYYYKVRKKNPHRSKMQYSLSSHRKRGFITEISLNETEQLAKKTEYCPICDCKLDWKFNNGLKDNSPSIDRKDNEKILTKDNTWIICWKCNTTKNKMPFKEFINYCTMVSNKFKNKLGDD